MEFGWIRGKSKSKSPSLKSLDSGQGSSKSISTKNGKHRKVGSSLDSLHSLTPSTLGSQLSIASTPGGDEKKKKKFRGFGSFKKKNKTGDSMESLGGGGGGELKRSKSLTLFRKKKYKDPVQTENIYATQVLAPKPGSPSLEAVPEDPEVEIMKLKRKLSLIRSFKRKLQGKQEEAEKMKKEGPPVKPSRPSLLQKDQLQPGTSAAGISMSVSNSASITAHLVDLEEEPKRLQSSRPSSAAALLTEDIPWIEEDVNPPTAESEISQGQAPDLSESPSTLPSAEVMITSEENQSEVVGQEQEEVEEPPPPPESPSPEPDPTYFNYSASAQRIRIKKPNLQRQTLERIFLQRRESESEADAAAAASFGGSEFPPAIAINGVQKDGYGGGEFEFSQSDSIPVSGEENVAIIAHEEEEEVELGVEAPSLETEVGTEAGTEEWRREGDDSEVEIVEEYLQAGPTTMVTVSVHPHPESLLAFPKRLSIISECEGETGSQTALNTSTSMGLNPEIEHSTIRRASDFTDSFRKLEPFKFDLPPVIEGKRERLYKVLVVGELGTGKTSIIKRYVHQFFSQHYRATIGVDFALKVLRWDPETVVRLQLWDIAGQERFGSMTRVYYKEAVGAFVVFDVARAATLEAVPKWKSDLDSKVVLPDGRSIPAVLLANKSDQPKEGLAANREKMNEFCQQQGFSAWFETSAKENINIDEAANFLVSKILEMDKWSQEPIASDPDKVGLRLGNGGKTTVSGCAC